MSSIGAWNALEAGFQVAIDQAWRSWGEGNFGIGAALVDPDTGETVSVGRNLVTSGPGDGQVLGGNFMAHAEMNAFAAMPTYSARGLHLYTTLEPCLMCAASAIFLNVTHVHYAAPDEYFEDLDALWAHHPYTAARKPPMDLAVDGALAAFCRLLPLEFRIRTDPDSKPAQASRDAKPELSAIAESPQVAVARQMAVDGQPVTAALAHLWSVLS